MVKGQGRRRTRRETVVVPLVVGTHKGFDGTSTNPRGPEDGATPFRGRQGKGHSTHRDGHAKLDRRQRNDYTSSRNLQSFKRKKYTTFMKKKGVKWYT